MFTEAKSDFSPDAGQVSEPFPLTTGAAAATVIGPNTTTCSIIQMWTSTVFESIETVPLAPKSMGQEIHETGKTSQCVDVLVKP